MVDDQHNDELVDYARRRIDRMTLGLLSDPKDREPVIPADLHLVKPPELDADGTVACIYCDRRVAYTAAEMVGSEGMACGTCRAPAIARPTDTVIRRRVWPWFAGGTVLAIAAVYGIWHHEAAMDAADHDREFPVANQSGDAETIARAIDRWRPAELIASVNAPPALATLQLGDACTEDLSQLQRVRAGDGAELKQSLNELLADARRGRYYSALSRDQTIARVAAPILVLSIDDQALPEVTKPGEKLAYDGGYRRGTAYLFNLDGTIRCAGAFEAESSAMVNYWSVKSNSPVLQTDDRLQVRRAAGEDLEAKTDTAIAAGLRRVQS